MSTAPVAAAAKATVAAAAKMPASAPVGQLRAAFEAYHERYIATGSFQPFVHAMVVAFGIGYATEYSHIKHEVSHQRAEAAKIE
eukprot:contig_46840_g10256